MTPRGEVTLVRCGDNEWERVVFAEILIPDTPNVYGDYWTEEGVKHAAYEFMQRGYIIDVEHDLSDVSGPVHVVESFIAREGDPTFVKGSWVVGMRIQDDDLWARVLSGDINGFSYSAIVELLDAVLHYEDNNLREGYTEPDLSDGHVHRFAVWVDDNNRPIMGGTEETNGHSHPIVSHTVTEEEDGHVHRYTIAMEGVFNE